MRDSHVSALSQELPPRAVGFPWTLQFCTSRDGYSLRNLYRKLLKVDSAVLLLIQDVQGRVFGGLSSSTIKVSEHFFGTSKYTEIQIYGFIILFFLIQNGVSILNLAKANSVLRNFNFFFFFAENTSFYLIHPN